MFKMILLWLGTFLWGLSNMILRPKRLSSGMVYKMAVRDGKLNEERYKKIKKKQFMVLSDYGYKLSCELLIPAYWNNKNIAILCHGFSQCKYKSLIYAEIFIKMGFAVLIYDHRNHGLSGKAYTSMGYYEKYDLKKLVDWCLKAYGSDCKIITHGESMGATTVLLHLGIDDRVICTIADCAYSDLKELLIHQLKSYYHLPKLLIPIESFITYLRAGFRYEDVSCESVIRKVKTPVLFIHGKKDSYVPAIMSKKMYKSKERNKALYLVAGAGHGKSCIVNPKGYEEKVEKFVKKYIDQNYISEKASSLCI
ncbi:alpha/beta hydrolase [Herbinix luporum]|nr:alpha/beta hydrolase [Herbinix luporum]MDI9488058.1 alpha/beta hydrolase [Bacillota bacterium]HHT57724.1 alpha/beta hydrolase [Herbinix luporum]